MKYSNIFLILASAEIDGLGFWLIDKTSNEDPIKENKELIECHRKELIGEESAKKILYAINLNLENINNRLRSEGYIYERPPKGIAFSFPLNVLEDIFDFWLETYQKNADWDTCIGLLNIKKRFSLKSLIMSKGIKGNAKIWAPIIENLHQYRPDSIPQKSNYKPMWK